MTYRSRVFCTLRGKDGNGLNVVSLLFFARHAVFSSPRP
jgi:hypothetical protein